MRRRQISVPQGALAGRVVRGVTEDADLLLVQGVDLPRAGHAQVMRRADDRLLSPGPLSRQAPEHRDDQK